MASRLMSDCSSNISELSVKPINADVAGLATSTGSPKTLHFLLEVFEPILSLLNKDKDKFGLTHPVEVLMVDKGSQSNDWGTWFTSSVYSWTCKAVQEDNSAIESLCR